MGSGTHAVTVDLWESYLEEVLMSEPLRRFPSAARVRRLEERLIAAGLTTDDELDAILAGLFTNASPVNGARMVARAWTDAPTGSGCWPTVARPRRSWGSRPR